jgi:hypothetical protein
MLTFGISVPCNLTTSIVITVGGKAVEISAESFNLGTVPEAGPDRCLGGASWITDLPNSKSAPDAVTPRDRADRSAQTFGFSVTFSSGTFTHPGMSARPVLALPIFVHLRRSRHVLIDISST